jgi:hypothetical protein
MSKSRQQGIIQRYYENHDTIQSNKLSELVSELWLAETENAKTKLWGKAQVALMRVGVDPTDVARVVAKRDMEQLAHLRAKVDAGTAGGTDNGKLRSDGDAVKKDDADPKARGAQSVADGRTIGQMRTEKAADGGYDSLEEDNLRRALKAFRRKLKNARRDDESRLGSRYVTYGRTSSIVAITPPSQYPMEVWNKLVELGRLKTAGGGTFELP